MNDLQWQSLLAILNGDISDPLPVGMIIDSPWLPGWCGISTMEYYSSESRWLEANLRAIERFPNILFMPGFWAEFGMCTEPSAFGVKCVWRELDLPFAEKMIHSLEQIPEIAQPDPRTDGLLPFVIARLRQCHPTLRQEGQEIRFAVSRGPLNIASFLMGATEFLTALKTNPEVIRPFLKMLTSFVVEWLQYQKQIFPSIDGIFILDDLIGFLGEKDFQEYVSPHFRELFHSFPAAVRFLHNDAAGLITARHLEEMGVNLYNFSHRHSMEKIRSLAGSSVTLLGNIPARDLLAAGHSRGNQTMGGDGFGGNERFSKAHLFLWRWHASGSAF